MLVATKVLLQQTYLCCDKTFVATNICCNKHNFVTTKLLLWEVTFVATSMQICLLSRQKCFVVTNIILPWQKHACRDKRGVLLHQICVCCDKRHATKIIFVAAPATDTPKPHTHLSCVPAGKRLTAFISICIPHLMLSPPPHTHHHPTHTTTTHTHTMHTHTCLVCLQERGWQPLSASVVSHLMLSSPPPHTHTPPPPHTHTHTTPVLCAHGKEVGSIDQYL